jgi:hypothetical protein
MAEENPHIEIKKLPKPINSSREQYLFENEKLILGRHGFIFKGYPTLQEKLKNAKKDKKDYSVNVNKSCKLPRTLSMGKIVSRNILDYNNKNINVNKSQLIPSKSQPDILSQPILRFKNRTDLERICDTIQPYVPPNEQQSIKEIRSRHVHSIDFPKGILFHGPIQKFSNFQKNMNKNYNYNYDENKEYDNNRSKPKIYFTRLQRLNVEAKKIRSNLHFKTHFKGVESIFINPKQLYDVIKKDDIITQRKVGHYAYNEKLEKERIEKRNEYKKDISDLLLEEKEKQNIINTKEFSNYLNNKEYFNDRVVNNNNKENEDDKIKKIYDMNYLKNLAFKDNQRKSGKNSYNESGDAYTDNSSNEVRKSTKKNINFENEHQLRIGGKIYHMQNQMDKIAREILNKCKFYSIKK